MNFKPKTQALLFYLSFGLYCAFSTCNCAPSPTSQTGPHESSSRNQLTSSKENQEEPIIWIGVSSGFNIRWTTKELYVTSATETQRVLGPLVNTQFERLSADLSSDSRAKVQALSCEYDRFFRVLSIIGSLVSLQDEYGLACGSARPSYGWRFTTIDVARPGEISQKVLNELFLDEFNLRESSKVAKLTDFFSEREIFDALMADPLIKEALETSNNSARPKSLEQLTKFFDRNTHPIKLGDHVFAVRQDFLTRFAFHHLQNGKVAVRISLSPTSAAEQALREQLGLLLPIPDGLRKQLEAARLGHEGFLMKDAARIADDRATVFKLRTGS